MTKTPKTATQAAIALVVTSVGHVPRMPEKNKSMSKIMMMANSESLMNERKGD